MTKDEKRRLKEMLDSAVSKYLSFITEDDIDFNLPCVRKEATVRQGHAFNLAEMLYRYDFISWEECCQVWAKIGFGKDETQCEHLTCGANVNGECTHRKGGGE